MAAVRAKNTEPERMLRSALFRRGLRFRINVRKLPGCPDIVFSGAHVVVFVDGDFWHGAGWRERGFTSMEAQFVGQRRSEFWIKKIQANVERDRRVDKLLGESGWRVVRLWESDVRKSLDVCVAKVAAAVVQTRRR
jgi:DNA mismatch endonuclease (patch repair protein)